MNWYLKVLTLYTQFSGRARRKEYWMFTLFNMIIAMILLLIDNALGLSFNYVGNELGIGYLYWLYFLLTFLPGLSVMVRRLHDVGKSGWMFFIALVPIIGAIWLLVLFVKDSVSGENKYGPNPKGL
ncbi:DUF805 domain-containing protein [Flavobacteriales bacterium]|nr:DUF805 domain-containing protein [Flavobacteriales bacterium]